MTPKFSCVEYCPEHELTNKRVSNIEKTINDMRDDIFECTNSIRESAIVLNTTVKGIERFNVALDRLSEKLKEIEISNAERNAWEKEKTELERKFNNRLIVFFTAIGAIATAIAVWTNLGGT